MSDLISRQAAIDAIRNIKAITGTFDDEMLLIDKAEAQTELMMLSSARPEIIRCRDCKHWDGADTCDVIDAPVWDNDFCSMAERRSDDKTNKSSSC